MFPWQTNPLHAMDTQNSALAASLDVSYVHKLAQLSEEAFWTYAQRLAGPGFATLEQPSSQRKEEYLECVTGKGRFLLPLATLYEIVPPPHRYTDVPDTPIWMAGLAAWRGSATVVIDLTLYLTGEAVPTHEHLLPESLLIAYTDDVSPGLLVHSNGTILSIDDIQPIPLDDAYTFGTTGFYGSARPSIIAGRHEDAIVLDVPALLADIVRQIEMAASHG